MGTIRVHTANERIVFDNKPIITSGNKNINDISVTFCDKWLSLGENTEFWAVFFKDEKIIYKRKLENGSCLIPNAVMSKKGWFYFGFYAEAENGEKVKTSKIAEYEVTQGVPIEDTTDGDENTDSGNTGGSSSGNTGENIDLSDYAKKDEIPTKTSQLTNDSNFISKKDLPELKFEDIFEPFVETKDPYKIETDPIYWKDNTTLDPVDGTFKPSVYPCCVTPEMYVVSGEFYKVEGDCYETDVYQYDFNGNLVECSSVTSDGLFKVCENTATIRFVVPKFNDTGEEIDLNATIERFGEKFKLYYCDKYKLKDRVKLPDNIVIPTRTSELENDSSFVTQSLETNEEGSNILVFGGVDK